MVGGRHEFTAERIHFCKRRDLCAVAEIIGIFSAGDRRAAGGFDPDEADVVFALQPFSHEGRDESAEIGSAAHAADDDVRLNAVLIEGDFTLQTDDRLVQEHVIEHGAEHITAIGRIDGLFHRFRNGTAERPARAGEFFEDLAARFRRVGRGRDDVRAVSADDFPSVGLLLIRALHHIYVEVEIEIRGRHGKRSTPLSRTRFGRDRRQALFLGIVCLRGRRIELVRAGRVVALEFIIDMRGRVECLFQTIGAHEGRRTEHTVKIENFLRNFDLFIRAVEFLFHAFFAEHRFQIFRRAGLARRGVQERVVLFGHVCLDVHPCFGHLRFAQINFVRNVLQRHDFLPPVCLIDYFLFFNKKNTINSAYGTNLPCCHPISQSAIKKDCLFTGTDMPSFCNGKDPTRLPFQKNSPSSSAVHSSVGKTLSYTRRKLSVDSPISDYYSASSVCLHL